MSTAARALPVILCGKTAQIAEGVRVALRPQYEVISVFDNQESARDGIQSNLSSASSTAEGRARAVIFGGAFDGEAIEAIRAPSLGKPGIVWLQHAKLDKPRSGPLDKEKYASEVANRIKSKLDELKGNGKLDHGDDQVYIY